jgi:hypothetical protein
MPKLFSHCRTFGQASCASSFSRWWLSATASLVFGCSMSGTSA